MKNHETIIRIIKIADCGKLTAPTPDTLTYNIGVDTENKTYVRITDNDSGGFFSTEWIALYAVLDTVEELCGESAFSALIFNHLYSYKSANNAGFLAAALLAEGVLERKKDTKRLVKIGKPERFNEAIQPLIDSDTSLHDIVAERREQKRLQEQERQKALQAAKSSTTKPTKTKAKNTISTSSAKSAS